MTNELANAIKKLEKEKARIASQLADINTAIESLRKVSSNFGNDLQNVPVTEFDAKKEKLSPYSDYEIVIPMKYDEDLSFPEKLLFALNKNNGLFAHDAADYIYSTDKSVKLETLKNRFTDIASGMARAGKLSYKKIGKKYKYSIKDEDKEKNENIKEVDDFLKEILK